MLRYPIVVADLDGTLFNQDHRLSPFTQKTLQWLSGLRVYFIFATGRHHIDVTGIQKKLKISNLMITSNGARAHDGHGTLFFQQDIPLQIVDYLLRVVPPNKPVVTGAYHESGWFMDRHLPDLKTFHQDPNFTYQLFPQDPFRMPSLFKIFYLGTRENLLPLEATIAARWGGEISLCFSQTNCLEVMAAGISKGETLKKVLQQSDCLKNYSLQDCLAFGDGMNDLEMLSLVGKGCIMGNAAQCLKDSLPALEIIGTHNEDAVAHYLRNKLIQMA